jgi:hypothetical protein
MVFRSLVAGVCTACCIVAVLPPPEASARSGGLTIGRGLMARGAGLRPSVLIGRRPAPVAKHVVVRDVQPAHGTPVRRFRRVFGARLPRNGIGVSYGSIYSPNDFIGAGWQYAPATTVADMPPLVEDDDGAMLGRRCGAQTVVVPSEAGGARPITIWRCHSE